MAAVHEYLPLLSRVTLVSVAEPFTSGTMLFFGSLSVVVAGGLAAVTLHSIFVLWFSRIVFGVTVKLNTGSTGKNTEMDYLFVDEITKNCAIEKVFVWYKT